MSHEDIVKGQEEKPEENELLFEDEEEPTFDLGAIGGEYVIGPLGMKLTLGNLSLLSAIDSPLMSGELSEGDEISFDDAVTAIYVLFHGKEVVRDVMNIKQKIADMMSLKSLVEDNPALMESVLDRVELISQSRDQLTEDAREFYETHFVGYQFEDIMISFFNMIADVGRAMSDLPVESNSGQKTVSYRQKKKV
jgi:hypothetical protein